MSFLDARTQRVGRTTRSRRQVLLPASLLVALLQFFVPAAASARGLDITEPHAGRTLSGQVRFDARAPGHPRSVRFYVDGSHRWTDRTAPYMFGSNGKLDTSKLSTGLHRLTVKATYSRHRSKRDFVLVRVTHPNGSDPDGSRSHGSDAAPTGSAPTASSPTGSSSEELPAGGSGSLIWSSDFETGDFSQWEGVQQFAPDRASVVTSPHIQGSYAARFEAREGEFTLSADAPTRNRSEAVLSVKKNRHNPQEGDDWWYRWWFYLPASTPLPAAGGTSYMIITQWPNLAPPSSSDFELNGVLEFRDTKASGDPGPGHVEFLYSDGKSRPDGTEYMWRKDPATITRDSWHKLLIHKKWSSDPNQGFVEIWFDDVQQTLTDGTNRMHMRTKSPNYGAYMKQGIYRSNAIGGTAVIYEDGLRIGTTRAAADPSGPGS